MKGIHVWYIVWSMLLQANWWLIGLVFAGVGVGDVKVGWAFLTLTSTVGWLCHTVIWLFRNVRIGSKP